MENLKTHLTPLDPQHWESGPTTPLLSPTTATPTSNASLTCPMNRSTAHSSTANDIPSARKTPGSVRGNRVMTAEYLKPVLYGLLNIVTASGIVFANKAVFSTFNFHYTFALTWIHTVTTLIGMRLFVAGGVFEVKNVAQRRVVGLAASYVAYIVLCNLSLQVNTVSFYQIMKIAVAPTVLAMEAVMFGKIPPRKVTLAVLVVCLGIALATINDMEMVTHMWGIGIGLAATVVTALYQIWAGSKQKELKVTSMQLLHQYTPQAALFLGVLVPMFEPLGSVTAPKPDTILGYNYTLHAVLAIGLSALLGLLVSLSTFLVIGATSSLTYNVVGHLKTVIILTGGCVFFGDSMPPKKLMGILVAMVGIVWYTQLKLSGSARPPPSRDLSRGNSTDPLGSVPPSPLLAAHFYRTTERQA